MSNTNYEKMELFADVLEPATMILADDKVVGVLTRGEPTIRVVSQAIRHHKDEVIEILARIEGVQPEEYSFDGVKVVFQLLSFLNQPEVLDNLRQVFTSSQNGGGASSGDATAITEGAGN